MQFETWDESGNLMFNVNNMSYGLLASGNLARVDTWYRWILRSAQLNPNDPSNYGPSGPYDAVFAFSVANTIAPIAFINGEGMYSGSQTVNGVTTFYFIFSSPATKIYVFDVMRNFAVSAGMKCFADDASNTCTFNSSQVPLNIEHVHQCPPPSDPYPQNYYGVSIVGGTKAFEKLIPGNDTAIYMVVRRPISLGSKNYAVATTFSRTMSMGMHERMPVPPGGGIALNGAQSMGAFDGCWGTSGGIVWATTDAARTQMITYNQSAVNGFANIPMDRYPQALVISIDNLPFPYSAY